MIKVGFLLHFYQPWWQFPDVLKRIVDECYRPIFQMVNAHAGFAFSANINWSLLELLQRHGYDDVIVLMRRAVEHGKVELFGTAAHHPILPLLKPEEIERQIACDREGKQTLGFEIDKKEIFLYLPEYAFSPEIVDTLKQAGCVLTVTDDALHAFVHRSVPFDHVPMVNGLGVFLRSREWGNKLSFGEYDFDRFCHEFRRDVGGWFRGRDGYVILATDAETFGHHHKALIWRLLKPMVDHWTGRDPFVCIVPFRELYRQFTPGSSEIPVPPGSWSTEPGDFLSGNYWPLWNDPSNIYHRALWNLVKIAQRFGITPGAEGDVMKVLSSCCWWHVAGRIHFNPQLMMLGANKALNVIEMFGDEDAKKEGRQAFDELTRLPGIRC